MSNHELTMHSSVGLGVFLGANPTLLSCFWAAIVVSINGSVRPVEEDHDVRFIGPPAISP